MNRPPAGPGPTDAGVMEVVAVTDPLSLGVRRVAVVGVRVDGDVDRTAVAPADMPGVGYPIATSGRYDSMLEIIVDDDEHLVPLLSALRRRDDAAGVESFVCLEVFEQTCSWGAR